MSPSRGTYFRQLSDRLRPGVQALGRTCAQAHARFILSAQGPDGGFKGRRHGSDLYYTAFAVRALALLGRLDRTVAQSAAGFLERCAPSTAVDLVSWLSAAGEIGIALGTPTPVRGPGWSVLRDVVEAVRTPDGGYARAPNAPLGSTYQTFLALLCYDLAGAVPPFPGQLAAFVAGRQREDGGFAETAAAAHSGTNATGAGVALALLIGTPPTELTGSADLLLSRQARDGGWAATRHAPMGDLLSTFTALVTLNDLGCLDRADLAAASTFVRACADPTGGYRGSIVDEAADVEYTFYGLGAAAILKESNQQSVGGNERRDPDTGR